MTHYYCAKCERDLCPEGVIYNDNDQIICRRCKSIIEIGENFQKGTPGEECAREDDK
jgi:DNA-directed RNA polymerase subunit RPC12/RpoP